MVIRTRRWGAGPRYLGVDRPVFCVHTRIRLRRCWYLIPAYLHYRRIARACDRLSVPGLARHVFVFESLWTFHTISVWTDEDGIPVFGSIRDHAIAARWAFAHAAEAWSAEWSMTALVRRSKWDGQALLSDTHPERSSNSYPDSGEDSDERTT